MSQPFYGPQQPVPQVPGQQYQVPAQYQVPVQQYPQAPTTPVPAVPQTGSLDAFFSQPSSAGGPSWKFNGKPIGTTYTGIVARKLTNGDVRVQTNNAGQPVTTRDGRPKYVLVVPLIVEQSPEFPDGRASWWCKGQAREELVRAMAAAGCDAPTIEQGPEEGARITVKLAGTRQIPNMNPQLLYEVTYERPAGVVQQAQQSEVAPAPAPAPAQVPAAPAQPAPAASLEGLTQEQLELLTRLTKAQQQGS